MKWLFLSFLAATLIGCETVPTTYGKHKARVTYYCAKEDKRWGSKTASGVRARAGTTIAVCKMVRFGTILRIPYLKRIFGHENFIVQDRGSAVEKRKASKGTLPVIDIYTPSRKMMKWLAKIMPPILDYEEL